MAREQRSIYRVSDTDVVQLNLVLAQIADRLDQMDGSRGNPKLYSHLDCGGNRVSNVAPASSTTDAINQSDLTSALQSAWPVGSVFISAVDTNPETLLGFGTWAAFGAGRTIIGVDSTDSDFDTARETGGSKTKDLSHTHAIDHTHTASSAVGTGAATVKDAAYTGASGSGGSATQDIMPPYIVVYMWERTA